MVLSESLFFPYSLKCNLSNGNCGQADKRGLVRKITAEYIDFEDSIDLFRTKNLQLWAPLLAEYIKLIIFKIKETEFTMISMENAPK